MSTASTLAFVVRDSSGLRHICVRTLANAEARMVPGTETAIAGRGELRAHCPGIGDRVVCLGGVRIDAADRIDANQPADNQYAFPCFALDRKHDHDQPK
jgi:hypothetical protein